MRIVTEADGATRGREGLGFGRAVLCPLQSLNVERKTYNAYHQSYGSICQWSFADDGNAGRDKRDEHCDHAEERQFVCQWRLRMPRATPIKIFDYGGHR